MRKNRKKSPLQVDATQLPTDPTVHFGDVTISVDHSTGVMVIQQTSSHSFISWKSFAIGSKAKVIYQMSGEGSFHAVIYVNGDDTSKIWGTLTTENDGSLYLANPKGITIGEGAQIDVGSLCLSARDLDSGTDLTQEALSSAVASDRSGFFSLLADQVPTAALISLGEIAVADRVIFDGGRIVIDTDKLYSDGSTATPIDPDQLTVHSCVNPDLGDIDAVLGYSTASNRCGFIINGNHTTDYSYRWIITVQELQDMTSDGNYALKNTITLEVPGNEGEHNFTPISSFSGRFDGLSDLGFQIQGLTIDTGPSDCAGLFGYTYRATIKHVTLSGGSVKSSSDGTGALIGDMEWGTLYDAVNYNDVHGGGYTGGLVGAASYSPTMSGTLINYGNVTGSEYTGGLVGFNSLGDMSGNLINYGIVTGAEENTGGLVGYNDGIISGDRDSNDSYYRCQAYNAGTVKGDSSVGGLVGYNNGTLSRAFNLGDVTGTSSYVGGAVGYNNYDGCGTISEVFNAASIQGGSHVGGLVGAMVKEDYSNDGGSLSDSYSTGRVSAIEGGADSHIGNAVGYLEHGTVSRVYSDQIEGKLVGATGSGGSIEKSYSFSGDDESVTEYNGGVTVLSGPDQLKQDSYSNLDLSESGVWTIYDRMGSPILKAFLTAPTIHDSATIDGEETPPHSDTDIAALVNGDRLESEGEQQEQTEA